METKTAKAPKTAKTTTKKATAKKVAKVEDIKAEAVATTNEIVAEVKENTQDFKTSVMNGVKEVTETLDIEDNVNKIKETAKIVNAQVSETAAEIVSDVKETGKKLKEVSSKLAKEAVDSLEINERISTVKEAATKVNLKVKATATNLVDEAVENGSKLQKNIKKTAKKTIKNANEYALTKADGLVEVALSNGERWQKVADKAVKGGIQLAEKQQEIVFSALEAMKIQTVSNVKRFRKLFSNN